MHIVFTAGRLLWVIKYSLIKQNSFSFLDALVDSRPNVETTTTTTKKVLIKTIETRDGQVQCNAKDSGFLTGHLSSNLYSSLFLCRLLSWFSGDQRVNPEPRWHGVIASLFLPNDQQKQYEATQSSGAPIKPRTRDTQKENSFEKCLYLWWSSKPVSWHRLYFTSPLAESFLLSHLFRHNNEISTTQRSSLRSTTIFPCSQSSIFEWSSMNTHRETCMLKMSQ